MKMDSLSNQCGRLLCSAAMLGCVWLLLALLPGCGGSPCSGPCLKINVKMNKDLDTSKPHELTIFLTPEQKPLDQITTESWTITAGGGLTITRRKEGGQPTREFLLSHVDWPQYFGLSALSTSTQGDAPNELKARSLNVSIFLGTTWLSKLKETNGLQVWFNAAGFKMSTPFYARASVKNSEANCIAYNSQGYLSLNFDDAKSFDANNWEPGDCNTP